MARVEGGVVVAIPARRGSTRLPSKPLLRRTGKYLVQHTWEQARAMTTADAVLVATDDEEIAAAVRSFGGTAVLTSPACPSGTDRCAEAVRSRTEAFVVNVQADEPEFDPSDADALVLALAADPSLPMATLAVVAQADEIGRPSAVKVVRDRTGRALYFSRSPIPFHRDLPEGRRDLPDGTNPASAEPPALRHVGIYAFRREALLRFAALEPTPLERAEKLEQLRALEHGWAVQVVLGRRAPPGIDTPEDYESFVRRAGGEKVGW